MSGLSNKKEIEKAKAVSPIECAGVSAALAFVLFKLSEMDKRLPFALFSEFFNPARCNHTEYDEACEGKETDVER